MSSTNDFPLSLAFAVATRYTRTSKKSGMLSFLSSISMLGLIVGIALLIVVLSVMNGFERELRERILALVPQASLYKAGGIGDWRDLSTKVLQEDGVIGAAPFIRINTLLAHQGKTESALIYGVDIDAEKKISLIEEFVSPDQLSAFERSELGLLVGSGIAEKLSLELNTELMMVTPGTGQRNAAQVAYMPVTGIIDSATELDQSLVVAKITSLHDLRPEYLNNKVDGLRLAFKRLDDAPYTAMQIANKLGPSFYQNNWQRTHGNLYHAIRVSKNMVGLLMFLIVALAAFNVVSTLILVVTEKQSSIAILRTLGASPAGILKIFIIQGALIGSGGVLIGILVGCGLSLILEPTLQFVQNFLGVQFLYSDTYPLSEIPAQIALSDVLSVAGVAMVLVFIATLLPALKAMRLQPATILRYE